MSVELAMYYVAGSDSTVLAMLDGSADGREGDVLLDREKTIVHSLLCWK
jgi:hypothetical protein